MKRLRTAISYLQCGRHFPDYCFTENVFIKSYDIFLYTTIAIYMPAHLLFTPIYAFIILLYLYYSRVYITILWCNVRSRGFWKKSYSFAMSDSSLKVHNICSVRVKSLYEYTIVICVMFTTIMYTYNKVLKKRCLLWRKYNIK